MLAYQRVLQAASAGHALYWDKDAVLAVGEPDAEAVEKAAEALLARRPAETTSAGGFLTVGRFLSFGSASQVEYYDSLEHVYTAALEHGLVDVANRLLAVIESRFPVESSWRTKKLHALRHEANGDSAKALAIYDQWIQQEPTERFPYHRQAVVYRAQGKLADAVRVLNTYLDTFMGDHEAWSELMSIYVEQRQWEQAAYCVEELILLRPLLFGNYLHYAVILLQMDTAESVALAAKNFAKALELAQGNTDAKRGIQKCVQWFQDHEAAAGKVQAFLDLAALESLLEQQQQQ